jgi:hypothetical protein
MEDGRDVRSKPGAHPVGGPGGGTRSTPTNGRLRDGKPVSTSWLLTKMSIRHLSYISTDLFWTKISTANIKVAFLPLGAPLLLWDLSIHIQTHKIFPIQKVCGSVTKKYFLPNPKSPQATNCPTSHQPAMKVRINPTL